MVSFFYKKLDCLFTWLSDIVCGIFTVLRKITLYFWDIIVEWLKLTASLFLFLLAPLSAYILWDICMSDLTFSARLYKAIANFATDNLGLYVVVVSILFYLTYLSRLDLKKEQKENIKIMKASFAEFGFMSPSLSATKDLFKKHLEQYQ